MITVSDEWKNVHKQMLLPESYVRIQLEVIDKTAYAVTPSFDNQASFSTPGDVVNNRKPLSPTKYALLEYNMWSLDGSFPLADDYKDFWDFGAVSKDDSEFTLGLDLHEVRSSEAPAFTITWSTNYNECATDFTVDLKNGDNVVATTRVTGNSNCVSNILLSACEYDSVEITVHEWSLPIHRARIESVIFGYALVFNKDQIMSYTHEQHGDPVSGEISRSSITFSLDNSDDKWNPLNPNGLEKYLYEQQKVLVYYGMDVLGSIEWVQAGVFYLSEWRVPSTGMEATFVANDAFALLTSDYSKNALCDICRPADGTSIYAYSDLGGSVTGDGKKTDIAGWKGIEILENSSYSKIEGDTDPYSEERQKYYRTRHGWVLQDEVEIISDRTLGGTVDEVLETVPFQITPCYYGSKLSEGIIPVVVDSIPAAELIQVCANLCGYAHWQDSQGGVHFEFPSRALTDYVISKDISYSYPEVELTKPLKQIDVVTHYEYIDTTVTDSYKVGSTGETITIDNPYLWADTEFANYVQAVYVDLWEPRTIVTGEFRADPRLELFDVVQIETKYGTISPVMITSLKYTYNGSFHGTYTGRVVVEREEP